MDDVAVVGASEGCKDGAPEYVLKRRDARLAVGCNGTIELACGSGAAIAVM